jgi:hypothetical protein
MKEYFKLKSWLILLVMIFLGFGLAAMIVNFEFRDDRAIVKAQGSNNVSGYAWSEGIGWISFNCSNDSSCGTIDYGVNVDATTGNFSGYAWSDNVGWISFNRSDTGDPPADPYTNPAETIIANYDSATDKVNGWAKILSLGDDGWINFNQPNESGLPLEFPATLPIDFGGVSFGVSISSDTSEFTGWAWNGNDDGSGIGWISFNCADTGAGGCAGQDYKVISSMNAPPEAINITAPNWTYEQACSLYARQAFLRWEFSDLDTESYQSAYQIIIDDDNDPTDPLVDTGKVSGATSQYSAGPDQLEYDQTYYWWVKVWDNLDVASELTAGLSFTTYKHEFPDQDFSWSPTSLSKDEEAKFTSSVDVYGGTTVSSLLWIAPDAVISDSTVSSPTITFSSSGDHTVTFKATDSDGYYCNLAKTININVSLPGWKEVKPE